MREKESGGREIEPTKRRMILKKKINKTEPEVICTAPHALGACTLCVCVNLSFGQCELHKFTYLFCLCRCLCLSLLFSLFFRPFRTQKDKSSSLILNEIMVHINYFIRTVKCVCESMLMRVHVCVPFYFALFFYHHHLLQLSFSVSGTPEIRLVCVRVQYSEHFCLLLVVISKTTVVILTTCFMASSSWWFNSSPNPSVSANLHHFCTTSCIHNSITHSYNTSAHTHTQKIGIKL